MRTSYTSQLKEMQCFLPKSFILEQAGDKPVYCKFVCKKLIWKVSLIASLDFSSQVWSWCFFLLSKEQQGSMLKYFWKNLVPVSEI